MILGFIAMSGFFTAQGQKSGFASAAALARPRLCAYDGVE